MDRGLLPTRANIDALRRSVARTRTLFEVRCADGEPDWTATTGDEPFDWDAPLPLTGAKRFFFPSRELLLRWRGEAVEAPMAVPAPFALFGLRACDLTAIAYQDRFFATDPWYMRRREHALLVGVNCLAACAGGFCRDVDAGPFASAGFDLNLTVLPDQRVVVEVGSALGRDTLAAAALALSECDAAADAALDRARRSAFASFPERPFIAGAIARINADPNLRHTVDFAHFGRACFTCTGCSNLCPTCSCFTVVDQVGDGSGERVRCWDSCLLEGFQREASGHHPAPNLADRVHRFWYHKLADEFRDRFGRVGCVGCGRCDVTCPGSIGALQVLRQLAEP